MVTTFDKTIVSVVMGILILLDQWLGIRIGFLSEEYVTMVLAVLWPILVYFVPNKEE